MVDTGLPSNAGGTKPPGPRIDVVMALEALARAADETARSAGPRSARIGSRSLVTSALARLGISRSDLATAPLVAEQHTLVGASTVHLTIGAAVALRAATRAEQAGLAPADVLRRTRRDVVRLLDIVPLEVITTARR